MVARRRWSELSDRDKRLIIAGAVFEGLLKIAALVDLKRRPSSQVRGPKGLWAVIVILVNSLGAAPLAYFLFGRRKTPESPA
jgi:hypothetical protein